MKRFKIEYTGKTMNQFPEDNYLNCPSSTPAWEVVDKNGASRFVGPYQACENFIQIFS